MSTDGTHTIVNTVAAARGFAFNAVERERVNHGAGGPWHAVDFSTAGDDLQERGCIGAEEAGGVGAGRGHWDFVAGENPPVPDGIFSKVHALREKFMGR